MTERFHTKEKPKAKPETFSQEAREALRKEGYLIYTLKGESIRSLKVKGRKFYETWHEDYPDFEQLTSRRSEVAINPNQLFLPNSNYKTLAQQEKMVSNFSKKLARKIKGVKAIIGEMPDYVELVFVHLDTTGDWLFGKKYNFCSTRTKTVVNCGEKYDYVTHVHSWDHCDNLMVSRSYRGSNFYYVYASPLVVPKAEKPKKND